MDAEDRLPVTLLFTDIEGSTRLLRSLGDDAYRLVQARMSNLLRPVFEAHHGEVINTQGDSFFVAFAGSALQAVAAALDCQRRLGDCAWPEASQVRVRIGIHAGRLKPPTSPGADAYVGLDVHHAARLCEAGHGGQVLLSDATRKLVAGQLPAGVSLRPLGHHQLRDMAQPEPIFQLVAPDLPADFPALRALDTRLFHLPVPRTALFGREREVAELRALLSRADCGLITLGGPAGIGKTRLAVAVASRASDLFRDGICFVALAPIGDPALVVPTIIRRLGLQESGTMAPEEILSGYLRDRQLLLVLDNFEHLLPAAPPIAELLATCPGLKVMATSRAMLRVQGECEYTVTPLAFPKLDRLPTPEESGRFPAVALFAQRAAAATARFEITAENFAAVASICARLDGLPLAIELAAARTSLLTPREILARLQDHDRSTSLDLLTSGARDAPTRHRTLRDAIGWSYGLLAPDGQALFRLLAIFVGGFTFEAAAALAARMVPAASPRAPGGRASAPMLTLLDGVGKLAENHLLQRVERPGAEARFSMLETIREYGLEQLEAHGEIVAAQRYHAAHFLTFAEAGEKEVGGPRQAEWLGRLDDEHPNFRAALAWSLSGQGGDRLLGAQLAGALWVFWYRRAYMREGSGWIRQARLACRTVPPPLRAKLLTAEGSLVRMLGDVARAEMLLDNAAELWRELGDDEGLAWALSHLGLTQQWFGQLDAGVALLEESLALRLSAGDQRGIARSLFQLAAGEDFRRNYARAAELYERTLEVQRRIGDTWGMGRVFGCLAKVVLRSGEHARAEGLCREALTLSTQVMDKWGIGLAQSVLGGVAWARGELQEAARLLKDGLLSFRDIGSHDRIAECLQDLASLSHQLGMLQTSVRLSASAAMIQTQIRLALSPAVQARRDADMAAARASLGDAIFERAWTGGQSISMEEAIDEALGVAQGDRPRGAPVLRPDPAKDR